MTMIYLDHAATTPVLPEVAQAMEPYYDRKYANPSGLYRSADLCRQDIESIRNYLAESIRARSSEIYFTSGGTESDNWVIKGIRKRYINQRVHYVTSAIEHHAILRACRSLTDKKTDFTYLGVDENGVIQIKDLDNSLNEQTVLVSVMLANNEVGTIQPIEKISYLCKEHNILFHTDAVQAYGHIPIDVKKSGIDFMSVSAHKFGGPKGVGFLYINEDTWLPSMIDGGGQESGRRSGTENVAGIIGMGTAARIAMDHMGEDARKIRELRSYLEKRICMDIPYVRINNPGGKCDGTKTQYPEQLPGHINLSFQFINGTELVALMDRENICISSGSACSSGSGSVSHVISAMGVPGELAVGTIRITIGRENTIEEMKRTASALKKCVDYLRKKSSVYEDFCLANNEML